MSIDDEIGLLVEVADIRDELHSLEVVLTDQFKTMKQLKKVPDARGVDLNCVQAHLSRIQQLEQLTDKAQKSVSRNYHDKPEGLLTHHVYPQLYQLVDLKQKHASFVAARTQAQLVEKTLEFQTEVETANASQGKSLMVFTVVTIIFVSGTHEF